ncbi:MAG TPA: DUF732 domain-containing protein [Mycobacterium sp.]|uniref:DUF732 domain-containing protein n=1 Tax=Mycobacterium sp. TaxID=1785 RepID=UPI002CFAB093|nr:DUF732 domain-containing protein [Mycobacterium sp.]HME79226.1 DUF732 domain-containing protein [Mycobacterium sp.]
MPPAAAPAPPPPTTVTVTETPTPVALPPAPVTVAPRRPDPDQTFIGLASQIPGMTIADPTIAEAGGGKVCAYLQAGHSRADTNATVLQNDPTFTPWQANAVVNAAITAYCPQYAADYARPRHPVRRFHSSRVRLSRPGCGRPDLLCDTRWRAVPAAAGMRAR